MRVKTKIIYGFLFLLTGCEQAKPGSRADVVTPSPTPTYTILQDKTNPALSKANVTVQLSQQISEVELRRIAQAIRATHQGYAKVWIAYYLPGMKLGAGAWATANFTPNLQVQILGASRAEEQQAQRTAVPGKTLGRWYETQYTQAGFVIYQQQGKYHLKTSYRDGTSSDDLLHRRGDTFTYAEVGNSNGEYFQLLPGGNLGMLNREGRLFTQAVPIK